MLQKLALSFIFLPGMLLAQSDIAKNRAPEIRFSHQDSVQYALGAFVALWMNNQNLVMDKPTLFSKGMNDVFKNNPRIVPDSQIGKMIQQYQLSTLRGVGKKAEEQLFESLKSRKDIGMIPGGIYYFIKTTGKGGLASQNDTLVFNLTARLANGSLVEDTYSKKVPYKTLFTNLFPGLKEPLKMMREGSEWILYIPADMAYGENATDLIPPYSPLVIDLELIRFIKAITPKTALKSGIRN